MPDVLTHELRTRLDTARSARDPVRRYRLTLETAALALADRPSPTGGEAARRLREIGFRPSEVHDFLDDAIGLALGARQEAGAASAEDMPAATRENITRAIHGARIRSNHPPAVSICAVSETVAGAIFTFAALPAFLIFIIQPLMG